VAEPTEEQMLALARRIAARNKSDPFAFGRAMCHIRAGILSLPEELPEVTATLADIVVEIKHG
jgi:hypothetical protein